MIVKIKWISGLAIVFLLIIATNMLDRSEFKNIKKSVVAIYEDRLVAQDLIFKISILLEEKSVALFSSDVIFFTARNNKVNLEIRNLVNDFEQTNLTLTEEETLNRFLSKFQHLQELESRFVHSSENKFSQQATVALAGPVADLIRELFALSNIQLEEGKIEMDKVTKSANTVSAMANLEIVFLIVIGLIIQVLILYKPLSAEPPSLN